jgi:hypothetical protein
MFKAINFGSTRYKVLMLAILLVSLALRLGLVAYNREANDAHYIVITQIMQNGKLPEKDDCWECFQPKFFHYTTAKVLLHLGLSAENPNKVVDLGSELINFAVGALTLLIIAFIITRAPVKSEWLKLAAFGLVAFNPDLLGINSQGTNDTFAISLGTLALVFAVEFLERPRLLSFLATLLFTVIGISTKTNLWVMAVAITLALVLKGWAAKKARIRHAAIGLSFLVLTLVTSIINPLNQYISNTQKYGSPMVLNVKTEPFPHLWQNTEVVRPGIRSIMDGYFTFRFSDLLKNPLDGNTEAYHLNRTSFWSQLYGRAHSIHFPNWPGTWQTKDEEGFNLTRALFIFALPASLLLAFGAILQLIRLVKTVVRRDVAALSADAYGLMTIAFYGYLLFLVLFTLVYRDFSVIKNIYIFPAILSFPLLFMQAVEFVKQHLARHLNWLRWVSLGWTVVLFGLYIADVVSMILLVRSHTLA